MVFYKGFGSDSSIKDKIIANLESCNYMNAINLSVSSHEKVKMINVTKSIDADTKYILENFSKSLPKDIKKQALSDIVQSLTSIKSGEEFINFCLKNNIPNIKDTIDDLMFAGRFNCVRTDSLISDYTQELIHDLRQILDSIKSNDVEAQKPQMIKIDEQSAFISSQSAKSESQNKEHSKSESRGDNIWCNCNVFHSKVVYDKALLNTESFQFLSHVFGIDVALSLLNNDCLGVVDSYIE